ncbi:transcription initiation factor TFIID subunit 4-like [Microplitis mediator]|uniref:transcription initiation factor TFIID subunit 4-like n=1 Tax=Microplitis mediator TaxID=375433 RepID=UPI002556DFF6|nr:transcription initiation factor TFIID subunit 4-like [Microplitis mediator]
MQSFCLQNQPIMPQDNNYQPRVGIPNASTIPNSIDGSTVMMSQHRQCVQISIIGNNLPVIDSDAGQHQQAYQLTSTQANTENIIVDNSSTGQVNTFNFIGDNNNNDYHNNNNNNKPIELTISDDQSTSPQLGQLNIPINDVQNIRPKLPKKKYKKTQNLELPNNNVYMKTEHGYQLIKIRVPEAGTQTVSQIAQAGPSATKTIASTTPTSVVYSVASPVSGSANPAVPSLTKTGVLPISLSQTTPEISATLKSDQQNAMMNKMAKKCCGFFNNLLVMSSTIQQGNSRNVKSNLTRLIQDIVDAKIQPTQFVDRLEKMLKSDRQPRLVDFLTKSLPQLRTSLYLQQITIDGIRPPPRIALTPLRLAPTSAKQQSLIKPNGKIPVSDNLTSQLPPLRSESSPVTMTIPQARPMLPSEFVVMPPATVAMPPTTLVMPPAAEAKPQTTVALSSGRVIMYPAIAATSPTTLVMSSTTVAKPQTTVTMSSASFMISPTTVAMAPVTTQVKTYQSSSKRIRPTKKLVRTGNNLKLTPVVDRKINKTIGHYSPLTTISNIQQIPTIFSPMIQQSSTPTFSNVNKVSEDNKKINTAIGAKENKPVSSLETNEEELNDVMTMGGIDIAEESKAILSSADKVGTEVRSCKEKLFLNVTSLQNKIKQMLLKHGLEGAEPDVLALVSHATEQRLRGLVEKMSVISEHRLDFNRNDPRYQVTQDVRSQLRFLEEVDKAACQKREAEELAELLQASKSRSKDEEQIKLKEKAKEIQKAEMEKIRQRDADLTALQALAPRKKPKLDIGMTSSAASGLSRQPFRPRIKKISMKDLLFVLQEEQSTCRSTFLYKSYLM